MNIQTGDALLTSIEYTDDIKANGTVYGSDIDFAAAERVLEGRMKIRFHVSTAFTGAGDIELALYTASTVDPTVKVKTIWVGLKVDLTIGVIKELVLESHQLDVHCRLGVINTGASTTGFLKADFVPIKS